MPLVPESADDARLAALVTFGDDRAHERAQAARRQQIEGADIFNAPPGKGRPKAAAPARRQQPPIGSSRLAVSSSALKRSGTSSVPSRKVGGLKTRRLLSLGIRLGLSEPT